jgi:hypothetical protein
MMVLAEKNCQHIGTNLRTNVTDGLEQSASQSIARHMSDDIPSS